MTADRGVKAAIGAVWMIAIVAVTFIPVGWRSSVMEKPILSALLAIALIALSAIDAREQRLPDWLTLPLIVVGLAVAAFLGGEALFHSALGVALGYGLIAGLAWYWRTRRGVDGIGLGDAKLLAAGGAWCGVLALPLLLLISSAAGLAFAGAGRLMGSGGTPDDQQRIAFGPFLCAAIWVIWVWRPEMIAG